MKKLTFVSLLLISSFFVFSSINGCGEESIVNPVYTTSTFGAYILSEGTTPLNSRLSFYSTTRDSFYQNIYSGNLAYPDGLVYYESDLYLVEQGPTFGGQGKLNQLDSNGGLKRSSTPFGSSPYSIVIVGQRAYITNGPSSSVSVLELSSLTFVQDIPVGAYPQELLFTFGKVFVCNTSAVGGDADSTISVIDPNTNTVIQIIALRMDPTSIIRTEVNHAVSIYAGCQGGGGIIYKIDPGTNNKLDSFMMPNGFDKDMSFSNNYIYFISGSNNIDRLDLSDGSVTTVITNPGGGSYFYGYAYDNVNMRHYVLDAKNFTIDGSLYIYSQSGSLEKTFTTGVGPRRVVFKTHITSSGL
jgi:YVTN family beta-propeller protein